jgi:hypothetical protein
MRKLLFVLLLLVVVGLIALGFYRGWFSFQKTHDTENEREGVQFEIDRNKIKPDVDKLKEKIGKGSTQGREKPEGKEP